MRRCYFLLKCSAKHADFHEKKSNRRKKEEEIVFSQEFMLRNFDI